MTQVGLLVLGWLFGLLTGPCAESIRRRRARASLGNAIEYELADLSDQAVMVVHHVDSSGGTLTRETMEWAVDRLKDSKNDNARGVVDSLNGILKATDAVIAALARETKLTQTNISFRMLEMPFLVSQLHQLDVFSVATQQRLLRLKTDVRLFNEVAAEVLRFSDKTFDSSITGDNHELVVRNLRQTERLAQGRARIIADSVQKIGRVR